jgi:hypothetical protein
VGKLSSFSRIFAAMAAASFSTRQGGAASACSSRLRVDLPVSALSERRTSSLPYTTEQLIMAQRVVVVSDFHSAAQPFTCGGKLRLQPSLDLIMITPIAETGRRLPRHDTYPLA